VTRGAGRSVRGSWRAGSRSACAPLGWLCNEGPPARLSATAWLERGMHTRPHQACPPWSHTYGQQTVVIMIGIDPHKESHTAVALDPHEHVLAELKIRADQRQTERLLAWAAPFQTRTWAIEGADGLGYLLA
jgi:transposase